MVTPRNPWMIATSILFAIAMMFAASPYAFSQTQLIAHRSHGGDNESFRAAREDGFGETAEMNYRMSKKGFSIGVIDTVIRLSDTSAIEISTVRRMKDTVYRDEYWNNPHIKVDSLRKLFPTISFIGFDKRKKAVADNRGAVREDDRMRGDIPAEYCGLMLMALCGVIVVPGLAYGLRRS
ncbi:MAG: hypothetical protein ABI876_04945 [Bacteroidota bacterium]